MSRLKDFYKDTVMSAMTEKFGYKRGDFPITEALCDAIVSLPMMDYMTEEEISKVIDEVNRYGKVETSPY